MSLPFCPNLESHLTLPSLGSPFFDAADGKATGAPINSPNDQSFNREPYPLGLVLISVGAGRCTHRKLEGHIRQSVG